MTIDELLLQIRRHRLILISEREVWPSPRLTCTLECAVRKHRRGLRLLIDWSSIATCPNRDLHRQYWRYAGAGRYACDACSMLLQEVSA